MSTVTDVGTKGRVCGSQAASLTNGSRRVAPPHQGATTGAGRDVEAVPVMGAVRVGYSGRTRRTVQGLMATRRSTPASFIFPRQATRRVVATGVL